MDSRNIPTQSSSVVRLLNSQQGSVPNENFPYKSFHSNINFGASEFPAFSSQQTPPPPPPPPSSRSVSAKERKKWHPADDEVLISAWLNTSKDAVVGNEQKGTTFWKRVGAYYADSPHGRLDVEKRGHLHCKQRWQRINDFTNKFCAAFSAAERQISSGQSDTDVLKKAHEIFLADHGVKFNLEHAWCVLKYEQKWLSLNPINGSGSGNSKRKNGESVSQTSSPTVEDHEIRPEGVKAAKSKRNISQGKSVEEYATIWEIKKEDLAMKEKLSKLAILDTLLAKKEPLTESEEVVNNKLLSQYF
ncbi:hypothetical protein Bca4012_063165 [Brassica carinata]